jgi:ornithine carbamoyltransferase
MARNFLSMDDLSRGELDLLLDLADRVKRDPARYADRLVGVSIALIFEKPSTRTRLSFEVGVASLGGHPVAVSGSELQLGRGEPVEDTGKTLSPFVEAIVLRTFGQDRLEALAREATVPVVNALTDFEHPCQCLSDLFTIREHKGRTEGLALGYVGDGNNVAHSLLLGGAKAGMHVRMATPPGYEPIPHVIHRATEIAAETGGSVRVAHDPAEACENADVLYTDVWASMGQENEAMERALLFQSYRLDDKTVSLAKPDAIVMHCLPAQRGREISDDVMDGPRSAIWDQAANELYTQKALLLWLLGRT